MITRDRRQKSRSTTVVDYFQRIFLGDNDDGLILREQLDRRSPALLEQLSRAASSSPSSPDASRYEAELTLKRFAARHASSIR